MVRRRVEKDETRLYLWRASVLGLGVVLVGMLAVEEFFEVFHIKLGHTWL